MSAVQIRQKGFQELISRVLHETGLASQYLELELTASVLLSNADVMLSGLQELKKMGLKLKQFPVSKVTEAGIIISMAKSLNLKVIAEGVENEAQMSFLRAHQCDEIQGYYLSKPLSAEEVVDKLRDTTVHTLSASHGAV